LASWFFIEIDWAGESYKAIAWQDSVSVLTFIDSRTVVVANIGDGEVFLSHFYFEYDTGKSSRLVGQTIEPGKTIVIEQEPWEKYGLLSYKVVSNVSDEEWIELLNKSIKASMRGCVVMDFSSENDPMLKMYRNSLGENLRKFPVEAHLYFYITHRRNVAGRFSSIWIFEKEY
jgi:hypothetical protein